MWSNQLAKALERESLVIAEDYTEHGSLQIESGHDEPIVFGQRETVTVGVSYGETAADCVQSQARAFLGEESIPEFFT